MSLLLPDQGRTALVVALFLAVAANAESQSGTPSQDLDPLSEMSWTVTGGAAPGYVDDQACELCR